MPRLMLDIETFSRQPNAAVFEVAIVPFYGNGMINAPGYGVAPGHWRGVPETGHFEGATVAWWMRRGGRPDLEGGILSEEEVAEKIHAYLAQFPDDTELWAGPSSFDCVILQQFLDRHGLEMPLGFRQWRDLTTLRAAAGFPEVPRVHKKHEAFNDCLHQIAVYAECRRLLGLGLDGQQPSGAQKAVCAAEVPTDPTKFPDGMRTSLPTAREFAEASTSLARGTPGATVDDGGPAFPFGGFALPNDEWLEVSSGVSKRELCSWMAMVGILANSDPHRVRRVGIRTEAERMADAMMGHTPTPAALTDNQVAYLEEKRGSDVWTAEDFNRHLRSMLD